MALQEIPSVFLWVSPRMLGKVFAPLLGEMKTSINTRAGAGLAQSVVTDRPAAVLRPDAPDPDTLRTTLQRQAEMLRLFERQGQLDTDGARLQQRIAAALELLDGLAEMDLST